MLVIARSAATKQSDCLPGNSLDCFAEPVIGRAFARPVGSQSRTLFLGTPTNPNRHKVGDLTQFARLWAGIRALIIHAKKDMDGRDKHGHDG